MLNYLLVTTLVIALTLSSYTYGSLAQGILKWSISKYINVILGFTIIIGFLNIFIYPIIHFRVSSDVFTSLFVILLFFPFLFYKRIHWFKLDKTLLLFALILFIRMLITYNRSLAEESFDTVHYLSYIIEASKGSILTEFDVNGAVRTWLIPQDDFSSHFYVLSSLYRIVETIKSQISFDILTLTMPIIIWISTIFYFILNISLTFVAMDVLQVKDRAHQIIIILITQFFIGSFYYNSVFSFYGNTYRTLFVGMLVLLIFLATRVKKFDFYQSIMMMFASSAIMASSGSGYLISLIAMYAYVVLMLRNKGLTNKNLAIMYILFVPVILFIMNFLYLNGVINFLTIMSIVIAYVILMFITIVFKFHLQSIYKLFFYLIFPLGIVVFSLQINQMTPLMQDFFIQRSYTDMVWNYLSVNNWGEILFNFLLWLSLIMYSVKSKDSFSKYFTIILVFFINPITYPFIIRVLSYDLVYQRNYDALFNTFTIILVFSFMLFEFRRLKFVKIGGLVIAMLLTQYASLSNYHHFFNPGLNFNGFSRLPQDQVEIFEVLNTKIYIEGYDRAIVVSQLPSIKGFVSNINSVLDYNTFRSIDRFDEHGTPSFSPLWDIFIPRDYYGQIIFSDVPDYENTCHYLIEAQIDFVLVDSLQFYMKDGDYAPLYHKVRDCAKEVFSNERYILYQFYW